MNFLNPESLIDFQLGKVWGMLGEPVAKVLYSHRNNPVGKFLSNCNLSF